MLQYLEQKPSTEVTLRERELKELMAKQSIAYFPLKKALRIAQGDHTADLEQLAQQIEGLDRQLNQEVNRLEAQLGAHTQKLQDSLLHLTAIVEQLSRNVSSMSGAGAADTPISGPDELARTLHHDGTALGGSPRKALRRR